MNTTNVLQVSVSQQHWAKPMEQLLSLTLDHIAVAAGQGSDIVLFPETNLTGYDFPALLQLDPARVEAALDKAREAARERGIYVICGTLQRRGHQEKLLNLAHVIDPRGEIVHEYAKVQMEIV